MNDRNVLGTLKRYLRGFGPTDQQRLARIFVRHASGLLPQPQRDQVLAFVDILDAFFADKADIRDIHKQLDVVLANEWLMVERYPDGTLSSLTPIGGVMQLLMLACCKRELEAASLMIRTTRYQPDAFSIAVSAARQFAPTRSERENELRWQAWYAQVEAEGPVQQ